MELQLPYITLLDDTLTHQVRISTNGNTIVLSCICRRTVGQHEKAGKLFCDPIGPTRNMEESRKMYNDPDNHWAPFTDADKAKW